MKTINENTEELLEQVCYCDFETEEGLDKARTLIRRALKAESKEIKREASFIVADMDIDDDVLVGNTIRKIMKLNRD
jgi:hypothetical protein